MKLCEVHRGSHIDARFPKALWAIVDIKLSKLATEWATENCAEFFTDGSYWIAFENYDDALMFYMRFS